MLQPGFELGRRQDHDPEGHEAVRTTTIFRALASEHSGLRGAQAQVCGAAGDHVDLAAQVRHPEAMDHIRGLQGEDDRAAGGDTDLVGRRDGAAGVRIAGHATTTARRRP